MLTYFIVYFLLLCTSQSISQIPPGCEVTTTTGYRYSQFHHLHSNPDGTMELRFRVMAKSDAHIALTTSPLILNPLYEIVIGASGNNYTDLRRTMTGRSVSAVKTPSLLSDSEFRGFWVIIRQGEIEVGREGETLPYFHWKDPDPLPVHYYSLSSWTSTVAKWIQKCNFGGPSSWLSSSDNSSSDDSGIVTSNTESYYNAEEKLKSNLLQTYSKDVRPSSYHSVPVSVSLGMFLNHFDLTEVTSRLEIHAFFRMAWRDDRLQWNTSDYENVTLLRFPSHAIWQPDLKHFNSANSADMIHFAEVTLQVFPDGSVLSVPPVMFETFCQLDLLMWPWDTQTCTLIIGSWGHDGFGIDLKLFENYTEMNSIETKDIFVKNLNWEIVHTSAIINSTEYECCPDSRYPIAYFTFVLRRRSPLYRATITVPALVVLLLTLVTFVLPPNSTEKILISLINLLILSIFLIYFSSILPPLGDHIPLIVSFYSNTLVLVSVSLILAVITITLTRTHRMYGPPFWLKNCLIGLPGKVLGLGNLVARINKSDGSRRESQQRDETSQRMEDYTLHVDCDTDSAVSRTIDRRKLISDHTLAHSMNSLDLEWLLVANALDRLALLIYFVTAVILIATCF